MNPDPIAADGWNGDEHDVLVAGPKRRRLTMWQKIGVAVLVTCVFLTFIWVDYALHVKDATKLDQDFQPKTGNYRPAPISFPETEPPAPAPAAAGEADPANSPILAFGGAGGLAKPIAEVAAAAGQIVPSLSTDGAGGANALSARLKPTMLEGSKATLLPHPDFLITKGTLMPCTLQTAISTELAGFVKCVLPEAVRGTTGNVVLLDRGTTIVGEIQTGLVQGNTRVFVLWDRAETPAHVVVSLASPGTDELGRSGVPGSVNNHFWERFGSAMMLSILQGTLQAGTASAGSSSNSLTSAYVGSVQSNSQELANTALQNSINIPPTLEQAQGTNVSIFVARDIDFSSVYGLNISK